MELSNLVNKMLELGTVYGLRLVYAIIILIVGRWIAKGLTQFVRRMMSRSQVNPTLINFVASLTYIDIGVAQIQMRSVVFWFQIDYFQQGFDDFSGPGELIEQFGDKDMCSGMRRI